MFVWEASLEIEWEPGYPLGLFHKKSDAKKACQDYATKQGEAFPSWDNSDRNHATAFVRNGGAAADFYSVLRRKVQ